MAPRGFPHSGICGSVAVCASPQLIAACRALLRLPAPRHPPCAFGIFAVKMVSPAPQWGPDIRSESYVCDREDPGRAARTPPGLFRSRGPGRLPAPRLVMSCNAMQLSRCLGAGAPGAGCWIFGTFLAWQADLDLNLPRKEVIQPHLPVRLPCYDFTPLTLHTFDASAPEGLGRRLRVQTTRVV